MIEFVSCSAIFGVLVLVVLAIYLLLKMVNNVKDQNKLDFRRSPKNPKYDQKIDKIIDKAEDAEFEDLQNDD